MDDREVCPGCQQNLSRCSFFRHKIAGVCPGKRIQTSLRSSLNQQHDKSLLHDELYVHHPDESCGEYTTLHDESVPYDKRSDSESVSDTEEDDCEHLGIEVFEDNAAPEIEDPEELTSCHQVTALHSELPPTENGAESREATTDNVVEETEVQKKCKSLVRTVSYFLVYFQLKFKIPDRAIHFLLILFKSFLFTLVALLPPNNFISELHSIFPTTLYTLKRNSPLSLRWKQSITKYAVCSKCSTIQPLDQSSYSPQSHPFLDIPRCNFVEFPDHPQRSRRSKCNGQIMKQIKCGSKYKLVPTKCFLFNSITESLKDIMNRPGMLKLCNQWRHHTIINEFSDITDGKVWRDFQYQDGRPFLAIRNNIALSLNIDWFNPYIHTQYSIGAMYLTILNLPRSERYKIENTIIAGLIPGPSEPKRIHGFLKPVVDQLEDLWKGIPILDNTGQSNIVRAALLCFVSDLPATRKVCGFPNFNATLGCSKCLKKFPCEKFGDATDYSGYDRQNWKPRNKKDHEDAVNTVKSSKTLTERQKNQKELGAHYSELTRLDYFDIIRNHVIDPMHNIYLGTAKHMMKVWRQLKIIKDEHLPVIQERVDELRVPTGIGRIPYKIGSNFSGLTADQWLNWTNLYSLYALRDILPSADLQCWSLFVQASVILRQYTISVEDLNLADEKILEFCEKFETLYGKENCSPNIHLHHHIKNCIVDFGPISAFWAFPFERFNGLLENFTKNWMKPEEQILQKVMNYQDSVIAYEVMPEFSLVSDLCLQNNKGGSLHHTQLDTHALCHYKTNAICLVRHINASRMDIHQISSKLYECYFDDHEVADLKATYGLLYPDDYIPHIPKLNFTFTDLEVLGNHFTSSKSRSQQSKAVMAKWGETMSGNSELSVKVGIVEHFFSHTVALCNCSESITTEQAGHHQCSKRRKVEHLFAKVTWFTDHTRPYHFPFPLYLV